MVVAVERLSAGGEWAGGTNAMCVCMFGMVCSLRPPEPIVGEVVKLDDVVMLLRKRDLEPGAVSYGDDGVREGRG